MDKREEPKWGCWDSPFGTYEGPVHEAGEWQDEGPPTIPLSPEQQVRADSIPWIPHVAEPTDG